MAMMSRYPDKYFELAVVDPPYGIGLDMVTKLGSSKNIHKEKDWNDFTPDENYFQELHRVSKHQIIWGCNYYAQYIPAVGRIVHDKQMPNENTAFNFSHCDLASCSLQKRITIFRYQWAGNRQGGSVNWKNNGLDGRIHPTQKPVALYSWIFEKYAKQGDKILDTHLGSQSSRIAAHKAGLDFWGTELDKDYFEAGNARFKKYLGLDGMFNEDHF